MAVVHPRLERWEYEALQAEAGWEAPIEYLEGQAVVTPPGVGDAHSSSFIECVGALRDWQRETEDGGRMGADVLVLVGENQLAPDVSYWVAERNPPRVLGRIDTTPDLVIEIASPSTQDNDRGPKRAAYFAAGVREQWLIDPATERILLVDAENRETALAAGDTLTSRVLTGFSAPVSTLLGR